MKIKMARGGIGRDGIMADLKKHPELLEPEKIV